jgi:hypothetical protein
MNRLLLAAALLLPLVGLGAGILAQERALGGATAWRIPITGYDPRDPVRGRFIEFAYGWELAGDPAACDTPAGCGLCLSREGQAVIATVASPGAQCPARVDPAASRLRLRYGFEGGRETRRFTGRLFVSEARAPSLEAELARGQAVVVADLTADGRLVNRRIEPAG